VTYANATLVEPAHESLTSKQPRSTAISSPVHARTLKMTDDVLSVRYSPNGKLLAVSLLDSTVKVFYQDSLKFFLSLYGHKVSPIQLPDAVTR